MPKGKNLTAIDIGTEKICTIIANQSEIEDKITVVGVSSLPSRGIKKGQIVDLEEAIQSITQSVEAAERMAGDSINSAYISLSGIHISSINSKGVVAVSEPEGEITTSDVARVIEAARAVSMPSSQEIIHVVPMEFAVDSQSGIKDPIGMTGVRLESEAHLISASSTAIKNAIKCMSEVDINVSGVVFSGLASAYSVLTETEKELGVVLLDIGAGTTSMAVFVDGAIAHSSVFPIGAKNITNDLAIGMRLSLPSAEKVKIYLSNQNAEPLPIGSRPAEIAKYKKEQDTIDLSKLGISEDYTTASQKALVEGIIRPRLNEIFTLVKDRLKENKLIGATPAGIVLTGGGANTIEIIDTAKKVLGLPARVGMPKNYSGIIDELNSPAYATATGLIEYSIKNHDAVPYNQKIKTPLKVFTENNPLDKITKRFLDLIKSFLP